MTVEGYRVEAAACELFKVCRSFWLNVGQVAEQVGWSFETADRWCKEWEAQGILVSRPGPKPARGYPAKEYALAREWGGVA